MKQILLAPAIFVASLLAILSSAQASPPYIFQPGQTAKSSDVNENFSFVNKGNLFVKANGQELGVAMNFAFDSVLVLNNHNSIYSVNTDGYMQAQDVVFGLADCQGQPFVFAPAVTNANKGFFNFIFVGANAIYYVPKSFNRQQIAYQSIWRASGNCANSTGTCTTCISPLQNDPAVTGISSSIFQTPITIEPR